MATSPGKSARRSSRPRQHGQFGRHLSGLHHGNPLEIASAARNAAQRSYGLCGHQDLSPSPARPMAPRPGRSPTDP
jgi:hypothetical protein